MGVEDGELEVCAVSVQYCTVRAKAVQQHQTSTKDCVIATRITKLVKF